MKIIRTYIVLRYGRWAKLHYTEDDTLDSRSWFIENSHGIMPISITEAGRLLEKAPSLI